MAGVLSTIYERRKWDKVVKMMKVVMRDVHDTISGSEPELELRPGQFTAMVAHILFLYEPESDLVRAKVASDAEFAGKLAVTTLANQACERFNSEALAVYKGELQTSIVNCVYRLL